MKKITLLLFLTISSFSFGQTNVALNSPTQQSSLYYNVDLSSRAVDGNTNGVWTNGSVTHTTTENNPWLKIDLESKYDITKIIIYNRTDSCCSDRITGAQVYGGNINSVNPNDFTSLGSPLNSSASQEINNINTTAQYILIYLPGTDKTLSLAEIEVYGTLSSNGTNNTFSHWVESGLNNISYTNNSSKVSIIATGTENFNGASLILAANGVNTGNKHAATWFINHRSAGDNDGTATFEMQRRDVNGNHQGNLLKYRDGEGWLFNTAESKTGNVTNAMSINETGSIGIGTENVPTNYKLAVNGRIISEELKVQLKTDWPDYVFKNDYKLPTLKDVAKHIKEKGHLKDVPSAKEVKENGILLGEMNAKLLQKIEELTLYTLEQEEKLKKMNNLENRILKLEALLNK